MSKFYVGIAGKARSGKDTLATMLSMMLPETSICMSLADPIKDGVEAMFYAFIHRTTGKEDVMPELGKSPREIYQSLGTEWARDFLGEDVWMKVLKADSLSTYHDIIIVPDIRFDNEAQEVDFMIRVSRDDVPESVGIEGHASEAGINPRYVDLEVANNDSLDRLHKRAKAIAEIISQAYLERDDEN